MAQKQYSLFLPDRFDTLQRRALKTDLQSIVVPVQPSLSLIKNIYEDIQTSGRGHFLILRGESGSGKSTFLNTLSFFLDDVFVEAVDNKTDISEALSKRKSTEHSLQVLIIEGREALRDVEISYIEKSIHSINSFLRTQSGEKALIVWPTNTDDIMNIIIDVSKRVGSDALLGVKIQHIILLAQ